MGGVEEDVVSSPESCGCGGSKGNCDCNPDSDEYEFNFLEQDDVSSGDDEAEDDWEWRNYDRQVRRSGGFHVDPLPSRGIIGAIRPIELEDWREDLEKCTKIAIEHYNKNQNANLEFVNLVKANAECVRGPQYYITFEAKDSSSGETRNYQAVVWNGIWEIFVLLCRPERTKPDSTKEVHTNSQPVHTEPKVKEKEVAAPEDVEDEMEENQKRHLNAVFIGHVGDPKK